MIRTLRISFSLKNAYRVNTILYALKQLPLIKKLLPNRLYQNRGLKIFANIISVLWEVISAFFGKFLYLLIMVVLAGTLYKDENPGDLFFHMLIFLTLIGCFANTYMFNPSKDKFYAIVLMRMNAKDYTLVNYGYSILKVLVGFAILTPILGSYCNVPLWQCLIVPLFVAGTKLTFSYAKLMDYEKTGNVFSENHLGKRQWISMLILLGCAYGFPAIHVVLPADVSIFVLLVPIVTGLFAVRKIIGFSQYHEIYHSLLTNSMVTLQNIKSTAVANQQNKIISNVTATSNKSGFEYLNELFVKRHKKILWNASMKITWGAVVAFAVLLLVLYLNPSERKELNGYLRTGLPYFIFIMYMINRGTRFTTALFMNCDHSLLTYAFCKKPKMILALFRIRLREIIKVNLLTAVVIAIGVDILLYVSGGVDSVYDYLVFAVSILCMSCFFSIHYLTVYYLLQPYNANTETKSAAYQIVLTLTYGFCYAIFQQRVPIMLFGILTIAFCIVYFIVACFLIYKFAPRTFRIRT